MEIETTKGLGFNSTVPENDTIGFHSNTGKKILKLCENGDIFVNGKFTENDKEVVDGMREFLISAGCLKEKK